MEFAKKGGGTQILIWVPSDHPEPEYFRRRARRWPGKHRKRGHVLARQVGVAGAQYAPLSFRATAALKFLTKVGPKKSKKGAQKYAQKATESRSPKNALQRETTKVWVFFSRFSRTPIFAIFSTEKSKKSAQWLLEQVPQGVSETPLGGAGWVGLGYPSARVGARVIPSPSLNCRLEGKPIRAPTHHLEPK